MQEPSQETDERSPGLGAGVFFLFWAALGWYGLLSNSPIWATLTAPGLDPGPAILPVFACTALTLGGLWYAGVGLAGRGSGLKSGFLATLKTPAIFFASAVLMASVINLIGFRIAGFGFALLWLFVFGRRDKGLAYRGGVALVLATLIIAFIELVFVQALRVPLP
ncbi:MAG: tripartite tricarboxylate transporter TctB family protein [Pseudomonadota bacterium]